MHKKRIWVFRLCNISEAKKMNNLVSSCRSYVQISLIRCTHYTDVKYRRISSILFHGRCSFGVYFGSAKPRFTVYYESLLLWLIPHQFLRVKYVNLPWYAGSSKSLIDNSTLSGSGKNITTDNWYSSFPLTLSLKRNHCVDWSYSARLARNTDEVPLEFTIKNKIVSFISSCSVSQINELSILSYKAKSNKFHPCTTMLQ